MSCCCFFCIFPKLFNFSNFQKPFLSFFLTTFLIKKHVLERNQDIEISAREVQQALPFSSGSWTSLLNYAYCLVIFPAKSGSIASKMRVEDGCCCHSGRAHALKSGGHGLESLRVLGFFLLLLFLLSFTGGLPLIRSLKEVCCVSNQKMNIQLFCLKQNRLNKLRSSKKDTGKERINLKFQQVFPGRLHHPLITGLVQGQSDSTPQTTIAKTLCHLQVSQT